MKYDTLIILPCHSIWKGGNFYGDSPDEWFLAPFQIEGSDHRCFKDHIKESMALVETNPSALLIISGGQTKKEAGPISESLSYYQLARKLYPNNEANFKRVYLEEYARDSFENVLFSLCRFFEVNGSYPTSICVVGFEFKRERFIKQHLSTALNFPVSRLTYFGNNPTPNDEVAEYFEELSASELQYAVRPFEKDPYGLREPLSTKKVQRNPFQRNPGYSNSNPSLKDFLTCILQSGCSLSDDEIKQKIGVYW